MSKVVNVAIWGTGIIGSSLLDIIAQEQTKISQELDVKLNVFAIANVDSGVIDLNGLLPNWKSLLDESKKQLNLKELANLVKEAKLTNLIFVDVTASLEVATFYPELIEAGFNLVAANKKANASGKEFYSLLRRKLKEHHKEFLYETNVGAALPLIATLRSQLQSGDKIKSIRGVFSGSLSYIFNNYSIKNQPFSSIVHEAVNLGFAEPDPREDLGGKDVARKLLILARELGYENEIDDVIVHNLVPSSIEKVSLEEFYKRENELDDFLQQAKNLLGKDEVLRYIGEIDQAGNLLVKLIRVATNSSFGGLSGSDAIFEIYTEYYGNNPLVIRGAGAGPKVTAGGVLGDILKIAHKSCCC